MLIKKKNISNRYPLDPVNESLVEQDFNYQEINFKPIPPIANKKNSLTSEDESKIQDLINLRKQELLENLEAEISQKKHIALAEIQSMTDSARVQADMIIDEATQKANEIENELNKQQEHFESQKKEFIEQIEIERNQAFEQGMQEARVYFDEFNKYLVEFHKMEKTALLEALPHITSIALDVARQILQYEAEQNPKLLEQQVLRSIEKVINSKGVIQIYLNPVEIKSQTKLEKSLLRLLDQNTRVVFLEDPKVDIGSCIINTQGGRLNASFRAQLELIKNSFEKYLGFEIDDSILNISDSRSVDSIEKNIKIKSREEPSDAELGLIENEELDLDFEEDLSSLLDDLMAGIENEPLAKIQDKSKNLSKKQKSGFNNRDKDLLMEDQMAKFLDDEFENNEELDEEDEETFEFEEELDEEEEEEEEDIEEFEEFGEDDFADEEDDEDDEDDPRYPEY